MDVRITSSGRFFYKLGTGKEEHYHQDDYQVQLKSNFADMSNLGGPAAGIDPAGRPRRRRRGNSR